MNPLEQLKLCTGMTNAQLGTALARRAGNAPVSATQFERWCNGTATIPQWVERASLTWLVELWRAERSGCAANELYRIDQKYTRMLKDFTVAEVMQLLRG